MLGSVSFAFRLRLVTSRGPAYPSRSPLRLSFNCYGARTSAQSQANYAQTQASYLAGFPVASVLQAASSACFPVVGHSRLEALQSFTALVRTAPVLLRPPIARRGETAACRPSEQACSFAVAVHVAVLSPPPRLRRGRCPIRGRRATLPSRTEGRNKCTAVSRRCADSSRHCS